MVKVNSITIQHLRPMRSIQLSQSFVMQNNKIACGRAQRCDGNEELGAGD